jgi:hypothetical protein
MTVAIPPEMTPSTRCLEQHLGTDRRVLMGIGWSASDVPRQYLSLASVVFFFLVSYSL